MKKIDEMQQYYSGNGADFANDLDLLFVEKSDITDADVLPGRGKANKDHPGNVLYSGIRGTFFDVYTFLLQR